MGTSWYSGDEKAAPWGVLQAQVHQQIKERRLLPQGAPVLVAVSGGQDSLCLFRLLLDLQPKWQWRLAVAHCDHGWPGDQGNAAFVQEVADRWQVPWFLATTTDLAETEASARTWRYQALTAIAQEQNFTHVATGHTASDRAETLLYNLVRGSGSDGLQAMTWQRALSPTIQLVRPLLRLTRRETAEFCQHRDIIPWQDPTNSDRRFARSRIRQDVIPYLQAHLNPQVETTLAQTAEVLQAEVAYLEAEAAQLLQQAWEKSTLGLQRSLLAQAPLALQRRALRQFLQQQLATQVNFEQVEKLVKLVHAPNRSQTDPFPGGAIARVEEGYLRLQ